MAWWPGGRKGCLLVLALCAIAGSVETYDARILAPAVHRRFREALQAGMPDAERLGYRAQSYPDLDVICVDGLSRDEFIRRARQVEGWDRLAVIGPYGSGAELADEAAGMNPCLQIRLRFAEGFPQGGMWTALVIDGGRVVTQLIIEESPFEGVLERNP